MPDPADGAFLRVAYGENWISGSTDLADGQWHHIAIADPMRLDGAGLPSVRLYVDGEAEGLSYLPEGAPIGKIATEPGKPLLIGEPYPQVRQQLHGHLDGLFILKGALSQEAIRRLMNTNQP